VEEERAAMIREDKATLHCYRCAKDFVVSIPSHVCGGRLCPACEAPLEHDHGAVWNCTNPTCRKVHLVHASRGST
jgi:hypothetical protein